MVAACHALPSPPHSELSRRPRLRASRRLLCYARGHEAANGEGAAMKVLVIDDEPEVRRVCGDILREEGWGVVEAADGPGGLAAARQERPDAVLLDVAMPGMDGFQVAEALVQDEATRAIPIVFLTARTSFAEQLHGYEAGGIEYITKPFTLTTLVSVVRRVVERAATGSPAGANERQARIGALRLLLGIE